MSKLLLFMFLTSPVIALAQDKPSLVVTKVQLASIRTEKDAASNTATMLVQMDPVIRTVNDRGVVLYNRVQDGRFSIETSLVALSDARTTPLGQTEVQTGQSRAGRIIAPVKFSQNKVVSDPKETLAFKIKLHSLEEGDSESDFEGVCKIADVAMHAQMDLSCQAL